jgi:hypothetical protein
MQQYVVGKTWYFKEYSRTFNAGEPIELESDVADDYVHNEPGLLAPARQTTQARPTVVRSEKAATKKAKK